MAKDQAARPTEGKPNPSAPASTYMMPGEGVRDVKTELDRIVFFSDAVFAIAITLLALGIRIPELAGDPSDAQLWAVVLNIVPRFLVYALSFVVIGVFWVGHHRSFRAIRRYDIGLIWLNFLTLLFVAFLPLPAALLGLYPFHQPAIVMYSVNVIAAGLMQYLTWSYATTDHHLVDAGLDDRLIRYVRLNSMISILAFVLTIAVSFFNPWVAMAIPVLVLIAYVPLSPAFQGLILKLVGAPRPR